MHDQPKNKPAAHWHTHSYWLASALALASIGSHWLVSARLGRIGLHGFVSVVSARISRIVHTHFGRMGRIGSFPTHSHWLAFARTALVLARANSYWFALACVTLVLASHSYWLVAHVETLRCKDLEPAAQHRRSSVQRQFWKPTRGFSHSLCL